MSRRRQRLATETAPEEDAQAPLFANPFRIADLDVFDDAALCWLLVTGGYGLTIEKLAWSLHDAPTQLVQRIERAIPPPQHAAFSAELARPLSQAQVRAARRCILEGLFWELTYWKTPDLYEQLTSGEQIHPGIFEQLEPDIRGKIVLDAGAGSGRASFECLRHGAALVHALEPSPGLLRILERKIEQQHLSRRVLPCRGRFAAIPLPDQSVDLALCCASFTSACEQGGAPGLAELRRVTRPGGKIVLIWPRNEDLEWLAAQGFRCLALPGAQKMNVHFPSFRSALRCARRFYAHNQAVQRYLRARHRPDVPYSVLGYKPPCDYCWLDV